MEHQSVGLMFAMVCLSSAPRTEHQRFGCTNGTTTASCSPIAGAGASNYRLKSSDPRPVAAREGDRDRRRRLGRRVLERGRPWASDQSHSAMHALKIVSNTGALCRWLSNTSAIQVTPGAVYTVSAWLRSEGVAGGANVSVNFWTAEGTYIPATVDSATTLTGAPIPIRRGPGTHS
jgi:hypothetical protein